MPKAKKKKALNAGRRGAPAASSAHAPRRPQAKAAAAAAAARAHARAKPSRSAVSGAKAAPHTARRRGPLAAAAAAATAARRKETDAAPEPSNADADVDQTQRYRQWFSLTEQSLFLAQMEHELLRACCRTLPALTVRTFSRAALSAVATYGATPPTSPTARSSEGDFSLHELRSTASSVPAGSAVAHRAEPSSGSAAPPGDAHEAVYRTVRSIVAASSVLGHRSCQALWGPRGSGKHRVMRLVAQECAQTPNTLVLQLHGGLLDSDEDAIRDIARQLLAFLRSPQSEALRAADWSLRTGTFDFGVLFRYEKYLQPDSAAAAGGSSAPAGASPSSGRPAAGRRAARTGTGRRVRTKVEQRDRSPSSSSASDDDDDDDDPSPTSSAALFTSSAVPLVGGAASALHPLQRALLLLRHHKVSTLVCIRDADRFGVWCDQLLYVLAGLMHDSDGQGGGLSLLLSSAAPDLQQMEKRLSSRLTCEMRFIPCLPWTPRRVLRAVLRVVAESCACEAALCGAARRLREDSARAPRRATAHAPEYLPADMHKRIATLRAVAPSVVEEGFARAAKAADVGQSTDAAPAALAAHPTLSAETRAALCAELLAQLDAGSRDTHHRQRRHTAAAGRDSGSGSAACTLVKYVLELNEELSATGATADVSLAAVASCLCRASAGAMDTVGLTGRRRSLAWLDQRQGREVQWPWRAAQTCGSAAGPSPSDAARTRWVSLVAPSPTPLGEEAAHAPLEPAAVSAELPPELCDLLEDGKLVRFGYASRESVHILFNMLLRDDSGVKSRSISDLLIDVTSALGTEAAAALDRAAYRMAVRQLCRWQLLRLNEDTEVVSLCGSANRVREFLRTVLEHRSDWCDSGVLGIDAKDYLRMRSLV